MPTQAITIQVSGLKPLKRAFKALAEEGAPYLNGALEESGRRLRSAATGRARGGIASAVQFAGVKGKGAALRSVVQVKHPGAKSMEFGRKFYYRGYSGRAQKATGQRFAASPGQRAEPFMGIKRGDQAIGEVRPEVERRLVDAVEREYERLATGAA